MPRHDDSFRSVADPAVTSHDDFSAFGIRTADQPRIISSAIAVTGDELVGRTTRTRG